LRVFARANAQRAPKQATDGRPKFLQLWIEMTNVRVSTSAVRYRRLDQSFDMHQRSATGFDRNGSFFLIELKESNKQNPPSKSLLLVRLRLSSFIYQAIAVWARTPFLFVMYERSIQAYPTYYITLFKTLQPFLNRAYRNPVPVCHNGHYTGIFFQASPVVSSSKHQLVVVELLFCCLVKSNDYTGKGSPSSYSTYS
jgi:hypothetical protein